jgi:hypothetical protein
MLAAGAAAFAAGAALAQVEVLGRRSLSAAEMGAPRGSLELRLSLIRLEDSGWTEAHALVAVREAAGILAQCGVMLDRAELETLRAPSFLDFSTSVAIALVRAHEVRRPAVFLVRDTRNRPAFDAEAIGRGNSRTRPDLVDTVWITAATSDPGKALAHELAHVLMNSGAHSDTEGNLMQQDTSPRNRLLLPAQCARLRETGLENGLLQAAEPDAGHSTRSRIP